MQLSMAKSSVSHQTAGAKRDTYAETGLSQKKWRFWGGGKVAVRTGGGADERYLLQDFYNFVVVKIGRRPKKPRQKLPHSYS